MRDAAPASQAPMCAQSRAPNKNRAPLQHAALKSAAPNSEAAAGRGGLDGVDEEAGADEDEREQRDAHA